MDRCLLRAVSCCRINHNIIVRRDIMGQPQVVILVVLHAPAMPRVQVEMVQHLCVIVVIINQVPVVQDVHSTSRPVIMVHQVRGQHQIPDVISVQEQRGILMIPKAVAARNFRPHVITVIKNSRQLAGFLLVFFSEFIQ